MSNRMAALHILRKHFPDWQIILMTHDRVVETVRMSTLDEKPGGTPNCSPNQPMTAFRPRFGAGMRKLGMTTFNGPSSTCWFTMSRAAGVDASVPPSKGN